MRNTLLIICTMLAIAVKAQRPELAGAAVRDSVMAAIQRDLAEGLWAEQMAAGELKGHATLDMVIDDKGRCESVILTDSDLPIAWKNAVKDQWFDRRFAFKLAKYHKEKITVQLQFPPSEQ
jgi:hypothetical protein